jgi:tRNA1(Val) A37 N6-methylase TrmN6
MILAAATTSGMLLDGRVVFEQPATGYRAAIDPVLLAAAVPVGAGRVLELGAGCGAASLCLAWRCGGLEITAVEIDAASAEIARRNVAANAMAGRIEVVVADVAALPQAAIGAFDAVFCNPPFDPAGRASPSPDAAKRRAHVEGTARLGDWIAAARRALKPRGRFVIIHRADRLPELAAELARGFGDVEIIPLWPGAGRAARRVILRGRLGTRGAAALLPGLVLHEADGAFTAAAQRVLRDGAALDDVVPRDNRTGFVRDRTSMEES